jgi:hypothetical protein
MIFWMSAGGHTEWNANVEAEGLKNSKLRFITREDGSAISTQWLKDISKVVQLLWISLYSER